MTARLPNLDQLRVFLCVVEEGSFSAAARKLGRAQSVVTYAVQELEADLGVNLFNRSDYRPELSGEGQALLPRAKRVLREAGALRVQAAGLRSGLEAKLTIVVDPHVAMSDLTSAMSDFGGRYPSVTTHLYVEALAAPVEMVLNETADLCLAVASFAESDRLERRHSGWLDLVPLCAPGHLLAKTQAETGRVLSEDDVVDHLQLVLTDRFDPQPGRDHGVSAARTWRLADLGAKRAMLLAGIGWGSLPQHMAEDDLAAGRLVALRLERWADAESVPRIQLVIARKKLRAVGPAGAWLFDHLSRSM